MLTPARKIVTAIALTGVLAVVSATPSQARWYGRGGGWGGAIAAGIIGGLALGALASTPHYYGYGPGYGYAPYAYGPYYYGYAPYSPSERFQNQIRNSY